MTDNRTTKLRKLLDERGVEWKSGYFIQPDAVTQWGNNCYTDYPELPPYLAISNCTPEQAVAATLGESDEGCYLMRDGKKFPVELDYGFLGIMPISITVGGFSYLLEVSNGK